MIFQSDSQPTGRQFPTHGIGQPVLDTPRPVAPGVEDKVADMKAAIAAATNSNPDTAKPYGPAPSWAVSTDYRQGTVVRGIGAGNTLNLFLQVGDGTRTSGTGAGPVGAVTAGITTDNTCRWLYIGKATAEGTYPAYSTVVPTISTDVMNGYIAKITTSNLTAMGLTREFNAALVDQPSPVRFTGGVEYANGGFYRDIRGPNTGTVVAPAYPTSVEWWCAHFQTDCRKWLAIQPVNGVVQNAFYIEINGRPLTEGQLANAAPFAGGGSYLLDLSTFPAGSKDIKIYSFNTLFDFTFKLWTGADENIWLPTPTNSLRLAVEGDSISQGAGVFYLNSARPEVAISKLLGIENFYNNAVGGTGVIANANGNATTYIQRLPDIVEFKPDILVIGGFHNDADKGGSEAVRRAAVLAYLRAVRSALPTCTVFVVGAQMLANESLDTGTNSAFDMETTAEAAFDTWADGNSAFIRTVTNGVKFPGSTNGNSWFFQANGASPFGDSHPTPRYYPSYAAFVTQAIRKFYE